MLKNTTVNLLKMPAIACRVCVGGGGGEQSVMARVVASHSPLSLFETLPRRLILFIKDKSFFYQG